VAKREPTEAEELIESYQEFAHSRTSPTYWMGRHERLAHILSLWGTPWGPKTRKDGWGCIRWGLGILVVDGAIAILWFLTVQDPNRLGFVSFILLIGLYGLLMLWRGILIVIQPEREK